MPKQGHSGITSGTINMGHSNTFDELFRTYYAPLCFFATKYITSEDDAKDVIEDLFFNLWQREQQFESSQHAQAFLYRSAKNACLNFIKQGSRHANKHEVFVREAAQIEEDYLAHMIRSEVWAEIYRAIAELPPQCNKVITMSYIDGNSNEEIAEALDLSVQTVKNHKVRALNILRNTLSDDLLILLLLHLYLK